MNAYLTSADTAMKSTSLPDSVSRRSTMVCIMTSSSGPASPMMSGTSCEEVDLSTP